MLVRLLELIDTLRHHGRKRAWTPVQTLGRRGEDVAHRFLQRAGFTIVARNYRMESGAGELDLVAWDRDTLVIVEVKTRQSGDYGAPDRAIGPEKERSLLRAARDYSRHAEVPWESVRFDSVSIVLKTPAEITHARDVLRARTHAI